MGGRGAVASKDGEQRGSLNPLRLDRIKREMGSPENTQRASLASFAAEPAGRWPDLDPAHGASQWLSRALALALHSFVLF